MVIMLLCGLNGQFHHKVSILKMHCPFLMFVEAQIHLILEEIEHKARPSSPLLALVTPVPRSLMTSAIVMKR
jgi:hypothetical protein